jgi:hypothetical protein
LQNQADEPTYLTFTAIPDLLDGTNNASTAWDGNARAYEYFGRYYPGTNWNNWILTVNTIQCVTYA